MNKQLLATLIKRAGFSTTYELERLEHFANIVVLECCKVIDDYHEPVYDNKVIKEHFGIEAKPTMTVEQLRQSIKRGDSWVLEE